MDTDTTNVTQPAKMPELDMDYRKLLIQQPVSRWRLWLIYALLSFSLGLVLALLSFQLLREAPMPFNLLLWALGMTSVLSAWAGLRMLANIIKHFPLLRRLPAEGQTIEGYLADRWETSGLPGTRRRVVCFIFQPPSMRSQKRYAIRAENNPAAYAALQIGDTVQIRFLPEGPQISQLVQYP